MPYCLYASLSFSLSPEPQPVSMPAVSTTVSVSAINLFFIIIVLHVYILPLIIYVFAKLVNPALTFLPGGPPSPALTSHTLAKKEPPRDAPAGVLKPNLYLKEEEKF